MKWNSAKANSKPRERGKEKWGKLNAADCDPLAQTKYRYDNQGVAKGLNDITRP